MQNALAGQLQLSTYQVIGFAWAGETPGIVGTSLELSMGAALEGPSRTAGSSLPRLSQASGITK